MTNSIFDSVSTHPSFMSKKPRLVSVYGDVSNLETTLDVSETVAAKKCGGNCNCNC